MQLFCGEFVAAYIAATTLSLADANHEGLCKAQQLVIQPV